MRKRERDGRRLAVEGVVLLIAFLLLFGFVLPAMVSGTDSMAVVAGVLIAGAVAGWIFWWIMRLRSHLDGETF